MRSFRLMLVLFAFGCGDLSIDGSAEGQGRLALSWAEPQLGLVHGSGELRDGTLHVSVSGRPPQAAFQRGLAIAELVKVAPDAPITLGQPVEVEGIASNLVLIYRAADAAERWWSAEFPEGYSCAQPQIGADGQVGYAPTLCQGVSVRFVDRVDLAERPPSD